MKNHMRNKFRGKCFMCGKEVPVGWGFFQRQFGVWVVRCVKCVGKGNKPPEKDYKPNF
jgi:hypothetical protein